MEADSWLAARNSKTGLPSDAHHRRNLTVKCPKMHRVNLTSREARGRAKQDRLLQLNHPVTLVGRLPWELV